jgi:hypothetical protein
MVGAAVVVGVVHSGSADGTALPPVASAGPAEVLDLGRGAGGQQTGQRTGGAQLQDLPAVDGATGPLGHRTTSIVSIIPRSS